MFLKTELETVKKISEVKIKNILNDTQSEFTTDTLRDLQTLMKLKDAAERRIQSDECF